VLGKELSHGRDKVVGHLHHGLPRIFMGRLVFGYRFLLALLFVVGKNLPNSFFIPAWRKV
jgi:hypothetical protein